MNHNIIFFLCSGALFAIAILLYGAYYLFLKQRRKIQRLENDVSLYSLGKASQLSYKSIVKKYAQYVSNCRKKEDVSEFEDLAVERAIADVNNIKTYEHLQRYLSGYESDVSPFLLRIHRRVSKSCNGHVGKLFSEELVHIKTIDIDYRLQAVISLSKELSSSRFEGFYFSAGNKKEADKYKEQVIADLKKMGKVIPIAGSVQEKDATGN